MECQEFELLLSAYLENDLPVELNEQVERHLQECGACLQVRENVESVLARLPELQEEVPFFLRNRLYNIAEANVTASIAWRPFWLPRWAVATAGAVFLLLNLFYFTPIFPPANRQMHTLVAGVERFAARTGGWMEKLRESKDLLVYALFSSESSSATAGKAARDTANKPPKEV